MRLKHVLTALLIACAASFAAADKTPVPRPRPTTARPVPPAQDGVTDLSHAIPAKALSGLPSTAVQFRTLKNEVAKDQSEAVTAKRASDALARQAGIRSLSIEEIERQMAEMRAGFRFANNDRAPKVSYYDIREFIY